MRVILGLAALAAVANGQVVQRMSGAGYQTVGSFAATTPVGAGPFATINVREATNTGAVIANAIVSPAISGGLQASNNWVVYVNNNIQALLFDFVTNQYTGQMQYRWSPNYPDPSVAYPNMGFSSQTYICDLCAGGSLVSCNTATGPGAAPSPSAGYQCANLQRSYLFYNLQASTQSTTNLNKFSVQLYDIIFPGPNTSSYSFTIVRRAAALIVGDPQIVGMQGQDFQVHGMPDEIFNVVSYPTLQINARFTYLEAGACHDNFTACFAHPGTYISEEGFRVGKDKIRVVAGSFKRGLTVSVNGKKISSNVDLKSGAVQVVSHRRVIVHTDIMKITVSNSDHFLNQELELADDKLVALGATRKVLKDNERFHPEVPLHGLQGQTWRNVEYSSGLEYEGSIMDYHVVDGNIFGTDFVFNQFSS